MEQPAVPAAGEGTYCVILIWCMSQQSVLGEIFGKCSVVEWYK